ncbi:hypothetical protein [Nonomuraea sp. NPDC052265]
MANRTPHGDLEVSLVPFGAEAVETFLRLEQPAPPGAPARQVSGRSTG